MCVYFITFFQMYFKLDSWRWLLCQSSCSCLHLKKKIILYFLTYIFCCCCFCCYRCFYGSEYGPNPFASLLLGSLQETVRTKAERSMFTYDSYLQIWNMYKLNSILQITTEVNRSLLPHNPITRRSPRSAPSRSSGYERVCACVCVRDWLSYSKQDLMFTCAISEEFSSIADVGRIQTPEANADLHGGSTPTLRPSHTGSFSVSSPHQPVGNSFL